MAKASTPSFILELPLIVQQGEDRIMIGRFEAGCRLLNTVLDEALRRLDRMRQSKAWQAARSIPKGKPRNDAFRARNESFGFSEYALHTVASTHKNAAGFADRLGAHETQKIGSRVWAAVEAYAFGKRGRPRFKGKGRPLHSLEGKSNATGIRWKPEIGCVTWNGLVLPALLPNTLQDPYLLEALKAKTKYCRIVWRNINGQRRWFVQLVQEGTAPAKYDFHASGQVVALDIGPSTIAIIGDEAVALERFAPSVDQPWKETRKLQRAQDLSRRTMHTGNFDDRGRAKKGCKVWKKSERYKKRQAELAELERKLAAARKSDHGRLCNKILGLGNIIHTETLSYLSFQKNYGRSAKVSAPGSFVSLLTRKAESAGGKWVELDTRRLRMSQYDHVLNACEKKPLSQRWHRLGGSNTLVQRDCYSAFLAKHASGSEHNPFRLEEAWTAAESLLRRAGLCVEEPASGKALAVPTVLLPLERVARRRRFERGLSREAVGASREPIAPRLRAFRTHDIYVWGDSVRQRNEITDWRLRYPTIRSLQTDNY